MTKPPARSKMQFLGNYYTWTSGGEYGWTISGVQQRAIDACLQTGWDALIEPNQYQVVGIYPGDMLPNEESMYNSRLGAEIFIDAGVDVWMETTNVTMYSSDYIQSPYMIGNTPPREYQCFPLSGSVDRLGAPYSPAYTTTKTTVEGYESLYGACFDYWEELGPHFKGYEYECTFDVFAEWLSDRTSKKIVHRCVGTPGYSDSIFYWNDDTLDSRITDGYIDEVSYMFFSPSDLATHTSSMQHVTATYPDIPIGFQTGYYPSASGWGTSGTIPQQELLTTCMQGAKAILGYFDFESTYHAKLAIGAGIETLEDMMNFIQSLCLTPSVTKHVWDMTQNGFAPHYTGASVCTHEAIKPPNSFTNTGNEMILLKKGDTPCKAVDHTIEVSGTDINGDAQTLTYPVTLMPRKAVFLGPFPVDTFGALPEITYDSTNLYVSIIKMS